MSTTTHGATNDAAVAGEGEFKPSLQNSEPLLSSGVRDNVAYVSSILTSISTSQGN